MFKTAKEIFVPRVIVGTVVPTVIVGTAVPLMIVGKQWLKQELLQQPLEK